MAGRTDFYKEYLEDNFDSTKYTKVLEDSEVYKLVKDIIDDLGYKMGPSDAYDAGDKDSLSLGPIYFGEPTDKENYTEEFDGKHYVIVLWGGLNGSGNWKDYIGTFAKVFDALDEKCERCWLIELQNDCADDVYTAYIGVEIPKNLKESIPHRNKVQQFLQEFLDQLSAKVNEGLPTNGFLDKSE